jgi:predicted MFS family arabinose efflux permease
MHGHEAPDAGIRLMAPAPAPARRFAFPGQTLRAFAVPGFWRIWTGSMFWYSARWMELFVLQWQVLVLTGSAFQVALVGVFRMAPMLVLGLASGLIADRVDRRTLLLSTQFLNALASAGLAVLLFLGRADLWLLAVPVTLLGVGWTLDLPTRRSFVYDLMGPRGVVNGLALDNIGMDGAKMLGPIAGGLLWPVIGAGGCFALLAAGYLLTFWLYLGLPACSPPAAAGRGPALTRLTEGLAYVARSPVILGVLAITVVANFLGFPFAHLVPVVARQVLGSGPELTGLLLAAEGIGATLAAIYLASRGDLRYPGRVFAVGSTCLLACVLLFSFSAWYPLSFLCLLIVGTASACFSTLQSGLILLGASEAMRGRAMGTLILAIGFGPLGALNIGVLASALGAPLAISVTAGCGLLGIGLIAWKATGLWRYRTDP